MKHFLIILISMLHAQPSRAVDARLDYETLTHKLSIESLRAGSHDPSGSYDYYFTVDMFSLLNSAEERNLEFDKRKKIKVDLGKFGETTLEALKTWKPGGQGTEKQLEIPGDSIRKLAAQSMQEFKVGESDIAVMVEVKMFEKAKKYYFLGEDTLVAKVDYFPISQTKYEKSPDAGLVMQDDKGLQVALKVHFVPPADRDKE